jgi:hypothetical protein
VNYARFLFFAGLWFSYVFSLLNRQSTALCAFVTRDGSWFPFVTTCDKKKVPKKKTKGERTNERGESQRRRQIHRPEVTPEWSRGQAAPSHQGTPGPPPVRGRGRRRRRRRRRLARSRRRHQPGWRDVDARARARKSPDQSGAPARARVPVRDVRGATNGRGVALTSPLVSRTPTTRRATKTAVVFRRTSSQRRLVRLAGSNIGKGGGRRDGQVVRSKRGLGAGAESGGGGADFRRRPTASRCVLSETLVLRRCCRGLQLSFFLIGISFRRPYSLILVVHANVTDLVCVKTRE